MSGRRISNSISITTVYDGENSIRIDLDNQADILACDAAGKVRFARNITVKARIYDGAEVVTTGVTNATTQSLTIGGVTPTPSIASGVMTITWAFGTSHTVTIGTYDKTIKMKYNGVTYEAVFTLTTMNTSAIYQLKPSLSEIAFARTSTTDNTLTPTSRTLEMKVLKIDSTGSSELTITQSGQTVKYSTSDMPTSSSGTAWGSGTGGNISWSSGKMVIPSSVEFSDVYVAMFDSSNVRIDMETIPVVKGGANGAPGKNAIRLALDNEHEDFIYSDKQELPIAPSANVGAKSTIHLYDGPEEKTLTTSMLSIDGSSSGVPTTGDYVPTIISEDGKIKLKVPHITANTAKVVVKATYPSTNGHDYYAEFTANRTNQDKYDLNLDPNAIAFNESETWTNKTITISGTCTDIQGNKYNVGFGTGDTDISSQSGKGFIRLFVTYSTKSGTSVTTTTVQQRSNSFSVNENIGKNSSGIYFELRKYADKNGDNNSSYTICDYETVEIAKTANGDDAMVYSIECTDILKPNDDYHSVRIIRSEGSDIQTKTLDSAKTSWSVYLTASPNTVVVDDSSESQIDVTGLTINKQTVVTLTLHQGSTTGTVIATKELRGIEDGAKGELGKMCYIAGEYTDDITYTSNDRQTVAVEVTVSGQEEADVWVLEYSTNVINGHHVPPTPVNPTDTTVSYNGQVIWRKGLSKYNLIRTTYLFADFAKLGSGVVSGDWLFSANGTICGQAYNNGASYYGKAAYMYFDDGYPNGIAIKTSTFDSNTVDLCNAFTLKKGSHALFVRGRRTGGSGSVRIYLVRNSAIIKTEDITSYTSTVVQFDFTENSNSATYYLRADGTVSGTTGEVTHIGGFTPNYAVDLLTGTTYFSGDNDKYVKINNTGIEGFWNNDGFRLTADGLQRYDLRSGTWGPMFAGRRVDVISSNKTIDKTYDFILARNVDSFTLTLPTISAAGQGKVFTIQSTSQERQVKVKASGSDKFIAGSSAQTTYVEVNNYERLELVGYGGIWYAIKQIWENDS